MHAPDLLSKIELFDYLGPESTALLSTKALVIQNGRGQEVICRGERVDGVYVVLDGEYDAGLHSENGREVLVRTFGPGDLFGEFSAFDNGPAIATVKARTRGRVARLSTVQFTEVIKASPKAMDWLMRKHADLIRDLSERLLEMVAFSVRTRVRMELMRLAASAPPQQDGSRIVHAPTHVAIAAKVGTTREAVTREIGELVRLGLIETRRRQVRFHDLTELAQTLEDQSALKRRR